MGLSKAAQGWLVWGIAAWAALSIATGPADAKRKFSFGSSKSSPSAPSGAGKAAPPAKLSALDVALIGMQVQRATSNKLRKLYDLPPSKFNTLPDGRYFHIGEVTRFLLGGRYVGWISRSEFLELKPEHLLAVLSTAGFDTVAAFEAHLVKTAATKTGAPAPGVETSGGTEGASDNAASLAQGYSQTQLAVLAGSGLLLAGFLAFCFISWRKNQDSEDKSAVTAIDRRPRATTATTNTTPRAAASVSRVARPAQAFTPQPRGAAMHADAASIQGTQTTTVLSRRAPRDLSALTRKPSAA
jgi:hypothetical protein